jgi:hypothetical protein
VHTVNNAAYQLVSSSEIRHRLPYARPEPTENEVEEVMEHKRNRVALLAGIYEAQGDSEFYRDMLKGRSQKWGDMVANLTGCQGEILHEEVLEQVATNQQERQSHRRVSYAQATGG